MNFESKRLVGNLGFALSIVLLMAASSLYFYNIIKWANYPDFGFGFRTTTGINFVGTLTNNGRQAGLQLGDRILKVNGKYFKNISEIRVLVNRGLGEKNSYLIERKGKQISITITNINIGFKGSFRRSGFTFLLGLCYMAIGAIVFLMKPHDRVSWRFFLFTAVFGMYVAWFYRVTKLSPFWLQSVHMFIYSFVPAVAIHLTFSFPVERKFFKKYPFVQLIPYLVSTILFLWIRSITPTLTGAPKIWRHASTVYNALAVIFFLGSYFQLWLKSDSEIAKSRVKLILLGAALSVSVPLIDAVGSAFLQIYLFPSFNYYLPFYIIFPAFVAYAIVKHDLFDIDTIIKRTYGYVLTTGALGGIYGLIVLISNLAFGRYEITKSPIFPLAFILAVVFLFNPVRNRVQRFIDRVFYRLEYDYQETVGKISQTMRSLLNLDEICNSIMKFALEPMFVDSGSVMLLGREKEYECFIQTGESEKQQAETESTDLDEKDAEKQDQIVADTQDRDLEISRLKLPIDDPLMQKIAEQKKEVTIYDIQEDPFYETDRQACAEAFDRMGATLIVPLIYEDRLTGLISLGRKKSGKFYRREDINLLNTLANQGAVAIENARMVEEVVEKERMEEELSIARDLQVSMLPMEAPQIPGFEIVAYSMAAREVGGDFYDFINMGADKAGVLIGDVTGKSVSGALVMSASRTLFRTLTEDKLGVKKSMMRANRRIKADVKSGMFVALLYAVIDSQTKTLTLCSAGQTQPVYLSAKTGEATLVETQGDTFPLGILDDSEYEETQLSLEPGDKVIFYTDGIVEAMNANKEILGFERLLDIVKMSQTTTAESLLEEIRRSVADFTGNAPQHDDITIIVIQAAKG